MTTRRQHYVWREYLEAWGTPVGKGHQVHCLRKGNPEPFMTETKNIAVERDFYRLSDFQDGDAEFIRAMAFNEGTSPVLRQLNEGWITQIGGFLQLILALRSRPALTPPQLRFLDQQLIEMQEKQYVSIESQAIEPLQQLRVGNSAFFDDELQATILCNFVAHQYFRTKAMRDRIRGSLDSEARRSKHDRIWPVLRFIYATNLAYALFFHRRSSPLQMVFAGSDAHFITSDQPAINTCAVGVPYDTQVEQLELFYPVSPKVAILFSERPENQQLHGQHLDAEQVGRFNLAIQALAHEQLYSASREGLAGRTVGQA